MESQGNDRYRATRRAVLLIVAVVAVGGVIGAWKTAAAGGAATVVQAEPMEVVTEAVVKTKEHRDATTSIGTVLAVRSVTLRNELAGTVRTVRLAPGRIVEEGTLLVGLDVSVEEAELKALEARAALATSTLARLEGLAARRAISAIDLDNARAERDVAQAEIERTRAVIARKTIRAPFRARVGIADVHPGQFLEAGTLLTTLQGVSDAAHVDFAVAQDVAAGLGAGDEVEVFGSDGASSITGRIVAVDARVDPATRNATVRARIEGSNLLSPGASVRVRVPVGAPQTGVVIPVSALRKGPGGDHVFVLTTGSEGETRAHVRQVQAGIALAREVMILSGLESGERVAASGSFKLREGVLVHVAGEATPVAVTAR